MVKAARKNIQIKAVPKTQPNKNPEIVRNEKGTQNLEWKRWTIDSWLGLILSVTVTGDPFMA